MVHYVIFTLIGAKVQHNFYFVTEPHWRYGGKRTLWCFPTPLPPPIIVVENILCRCPSAYIFKKLPYTQICMLTTIQSRKYLAMIPAGKSGVDLAENACPEARPKAARQCYADARGSGWRGGPQVSMDALNDAERRTGIVSWLVHQNEREARP